MARDVTASWRAQVPVQTNFKVAQRVIRATPPPSGRPFVSYHCAIMLHGSILPPFPGRPVLMVHNSYLCFALSVISSHNFIPQPPHSCRMLIFPRSPSVQFCVFPVCLLRLLIILLVVQAITSKKKRLDNPDGLETQALRRQRRPAPRTRRLREQTELSAQRRKAGPDVPKTLVKDHAPHGDYISLHGASTEKSSILE